MDDLDNDMSYTSFTSTVGEWSRLLLGSKAMVQTWEVLEGPGYTKQSALIVEGTGKITYLRLKYLYGLINNQL